MGLYLFRRRIRANLDVEVGLKCWSCKQHITRLGFSFRRHSIFSISFIALGEIYVVQSLVLCTLVGWHEHELGVVGSHWIVRLVEF